MKKFILLILLPVIMSGCTFFPQKNNQQDNNKNINTSINNSEVKTSDYTDNSLESNINDLTPEEVFGEMMIAAKNVDVDKYFSYIYSSEASLQEAKYYAEIYPNEQSLSLEKKLVSIFNNLEYTIDNVEIINDAAVLRVNAIKNNRQKKPAHVHLIKDKGDWKINQYGWLHPADGIAKSRDDCKEICKSSVSSMFIEGTKECSCFKEQPSTEDLSYLEVAKCENKEASFRSTCYISYAKETLNEEYCKKTSQMNATDCFSTLALIKEDAAICDYLWDDEQCLENVANSKEIKEKFPWRY